MPGVGSKLGKEEGEMGEEETVSLGGWPGKASQLLPGWLLCITPEKYQEEHRWCYKQMSLDKWRREDESNTALSSKSLWPRWTNKIYMLNNCN